MSAQMNMNTTWQPFLDMAARQDERGYLTRFETAHLLFGQLKDTVQSWEYTVFGEDHPLNDEDDDNADGIALYRRLLEPDTLYSHSLTLMAQDGSDELRTHTGQEQAIPDGIGGFDGNRVRRWVTQQELIAAPNSSAAIWEACIKIINSFITDGLKFFAPQTNEQARQQAQTQLKTLEDHAKQLDELQRHIQMRLATQSHPDGTALEQARLAARSAMDRTVYRIIELQRDGDDLIDALTQVQAQRDDTWQRYQRYAAQVEHQQNIIEEVRQHHKTSARFLREANAAFNDALAQLQQRQQQQLSERSRLLHQRTARQADVQRAQAELDAARQHLETQKTELRRLQTTSMEHTEFTYRVQAQTLQRQINWFEQEDYRLARQNVADARLAVKKVQSQIDTNRDQLALHGLDEHGEPASLSRALANANAQQHDTHSFHFRLARTSAVTGAPIISLPVFSFEALSANTRPGTHPLLVSAQTAKLTEQGILPKLASLPRLSRRVHDVAAMLYLYDHNNRLLSHMKTDLKQKFDSILMLDQVSEQALQEAADMPSFNRLMKAHHDRLVQYSAVLENATATLDSQLKAISAEQRRADLTQFHTLQQQALEAETGKLTGLSQQRNAELNRWAESAYNENALKSQLDVIDDQRIAEQSQLRAALDQLADAENAIGLHNERAQTADDIRARVQPNVQAHLDYLQRGGDGAIPFKARWQVYAKGNAIAMSFLLAMGSFQLVTLRNTLEKRSKDKSLINTVELIGTFSDTLTILAQLIEKIRLGLVGEIQPLLRVYAAQITRDFLRGRAAGRTLEKLPAYLQVVIHSNQAFAFNRLLIRSVLISSAVNLFGAVGSGVRTLTSTRKVWQNYRIGENGLGSAYSVMALGAALQTSSAITALRLGFFGARATRFMIFTGSAPALVAGIVIEMIGVILSNHGTNALVNFLSRTTWGTDPYSGQERWEKDAAAEWTDLINLLQNPPQVAARADFIRCDQPLKTFEIMLPGFTEQSFANLSIEHRLATWSVPSSVYDDMHVRRQTIAIYHSPGIDLGRRLSQQLSRFALPGEAIASSDSENPNRLPYQVISEQTGQGLRLTFRFSHFDCFYSMRTFTLHTLELHMAYYPYGRDCIVGRHQTVFANPSQPEPGAEDQTERTRSLGTLVGSVIDGSLSERAVNVWLDHWHQEGRKYLTEHQRQITEQERSAWQQSVTGSPVSTAIAEYLGNGPSHRSSINWKE